MGLQDRRQFLILAVGAAGFVALCAAAAVTGGRYSLLLLPIVVTGALTTLAVAHGRFTWWALIELAARARTRGPRFRRGPRRGEPRRRSALSLDISADDPWLH